MSKILSINVKCSDAFAASLTIDGKHAGEYDGYVPDFMPGQHYGDYVDLQIDIETGKILNWVKPTNAELERTFDLLKKED